MRITFVVVFLCFNALIPTGHCQSNDGKNNFYLTGNIIGTDTGSIILWHFDKDNKAFSDTLKLKNGKFNFSGTVNRVCEALLWTNPKNRDFDDPSVIRFLLEPNSIHIVYNVNAPEKYRISGSKSQIEKQEWDQHKFNLLATKYQYRTWIDSLYKVSRSNDHLNYQDQISQLQKQLDSVNERIKVCDLEYISRHPNSYLSAYLLSRHTRKMSIDSLEIYFTRLAASVKSSGVGHDVLFYIYPLTNDTEFRNANPLVSAEFNHRLSQIKLIYDLSLPDTSGKIIHLSEFKGKYILIDFWASWCKPCIENIPAFNQLIRQFNRDSIRFISISLDMDFKTWKHSLLTHHLEGLQLSDLKGFTSISAIFCKVLWVPKYVVIDRAGRIINYDAPQPSDSQLKTLLGDLLKKGA